MSELMELLIHENKSLKSQYQALKADYDSVLIENHRLNQKISVYDREMDMWQKCSVGVKYVGE